MKNFNDQKVYLWLMKGLMAYCFLFFSIFSFANISSSKGQSVLQRKISLEADNMRVKDILKRIEETDSVLFAYLDNPLNINRQVSVSIEDLPLEKVLDMLFDNTVLLDVRGNLVIIKPLNKILIEVSGKVTDEKGEPIPGVNVVVKGTMNGTSTDTDGKYSLSVEDTNVILLFSFVGYVSQEVPVGSKSSIDIQLVADQKQLEEVVVMGYTTQKKENLTSSVITVSSKQLEDRPVANLSNMIAGQAPGVTVIQRGGAPGQDRGTMNIRGISSGISGPLYVVDGVIALDYTQLNPNDVESITILKDAAATAIYGINASGGVFVITTKRGSTGKPKFSYSTQLGTSGTANLLKKVNSYELAVLHNEASDTEGQARKFTDSDLQKFKDGSSPLTHPNTDWVKALFSKPGIWQSHNLSMSGGTENTKYMLSGSYLDQDGQMENTGYKHYTFRTNIDQKITKRLSVSSNLALSNRTINEPAVYTPPQYDPVGGVSWNIQLASKLWATDLIRYPDGRWAEGTWSGQIWNPVAYSSKDAGYKKNSENRIDGTFIAEYKLMDGLSIKGIANTIQQFNYISNLALGADIYKMNVATGNIADLPDNVALMPTDPTRREVSRDFNKYYRNTLQGMINYEKKIKAHEIKVLLGAELIRSSIDTTKLSRKFVPAPLGDIDATDPPGQTTSGKTVDYKRNSYFGQLDYVYGNRYLLQLSGRIDQSSKFHSTNRTGIFPAFSAGWIISNEEFFKIPVINLLKIRASYGFTGDEGRLEDYAYMYSFKGGSYHIFNNVRYSGVQEGNLVTQNIKWQTTLKRNIGIDIALMHNKLALSAEYFVQNTNDILATYDAPGVLGTKVPQTNALSDKNWGYELSAKYNDKAGGVNYFVNTNFAFVKSIITDLKGTDSPGRRVGDPQQNIFGYVAEGLFQNQDQIRQYADQSSIGVPTPGDIIYKDINGDNKVNEDDRTNLGTTFPSINYGLSFGVNYKGFDISMLWQGVGQVKAVLGDRLAQPFWLGGSSPIEGMMDRWTTDGKNPNAAYPITNMASRTRNYVISSFWIKNVAYCKLRNAQIGYTLPATTTERIGISRLRIYVSGENLLTISPFKVIDPEILTTGDPYFWQGTRAGAYPVSKRFILGVSLSF